MANKLQLKHNKNEDFMELRIKALLFDLFFFLYKNEYIETVKKTPDSFDKIKLAIDYISNHYAEDIRVTDIAKACQECPCLFQIQRKSSRNILRISHGLERQIRNDVIEILALKRQSLRQIVQHAKIHLTIPIRFDSLLIRCHRRNLCLRKHLPKLRQIIKALHHQNPIRHTTCLQKSQKFRLYLLRHRNPPSVKPSIHNLAASLFTAANAVSITLSIS